MSKTFRIKVEGTQSEVDAFVDSLPQRAVKHTSGSLPHRNATRVHKYVNLFSNSFTPTQAPNEQTE